jgi:hypothetical protein
VPTPPTPPSEAQLDERLAERRAALAKAHQRAKAARDKVTAARETSQRADRVVIDARNCLAVLDASDRQQQNQFEEAISLGRELPERSNGHDRAYLKDRVSVAEQAQQKFDRLLAEATAALGDALTGVRKAAAAVMAALLERETENLRAAEQRAAVLRAELTATAAWFPTADLGLLKVTPATAGCLQSPVAWQDQPAVRRGGGWLKPWQQVFDKLCQGDAAADFDFEKD